MIVRDIFQRTREKIIIRLIDKNYQTLWEGSSSEIPYEYMEKWVDEIFPFDVKRLFVYLDCVK